ncbi:MAG: Abnormal spindle-like microcephaly-assocd, ASPM-SPD-2-Hydin, partial [Labilithrix sp.]|nr:Abnormal spindle-like microcephaly-assocd, ASPM-SPD-2-Hydin [Labilithrix sp.]
MNRIGAVLLVVSGVFVASCASIIGFPDRTLEEEDAGGVPEAGELPDGGPLPDGATPDTSMPVDAGPARAVLSATSVDFGLVSCGAAPPAAKVVTITNPGGQALAWAAQLAATSDFAIGGASVGTIAPGAFATLTIESTAVPALSGARDTAQAMLTITTNDEQHPTTSIPVKRTAAGGTLSVTPLTADFGETPKTVAAQDIPVTFKNTGNQPITVGFATPTPAAGFSLTWTGAPAAVALAPGASVPLLVGHFLPGVTLGTYSSSSALTVTGTLCGTNPTELTLTGAATSSDANVSPGSLDFGLVDCGTSAASKTVKITNASPTDAFNWTATLANGTHYMLDAASGTVAANSSANVVVSPGMIPATSDVSPNLYG